MSSSRSAPHPDDVQPAREGMRVGFQFFLAPQQLEELARRKGVERLSRREVVTLIEAAVFRYLDSLAGM